MVVSLFAVFCLLKAAYTILDKRFQESITNDSKSFAVYNLYNAIAAIIVFTVLMLATKVPFTVNKPTMIYSVVYAVVVAVNLILAVLCMSRVSVSIYSVLTTAGSIMVSTLFGVIYLNEEFTIKLAISVILLIVSIILPYKNMRTEKMKFSDVFICLALFFTVGLNGIVSKLYAIDKTVNPSLTFFLMTNVVLLVFTYIAFAILRIKTKEPLHILKFFSVKQIGNIGTKTAISNIFSIITVAILTSVDISVFTIVSSSMVLVSNALISKFYFKEKQSKEVIISVVVAIFAIILSV